MPSVCWTRGCHARTSQFAGEQRAVSRQYPCSYNCVMPLVLILLLPLQKPRCCTAPCEVLGVGTPQWTVQDYRNPATGGINLTYTGVIPEPNDKNVCPINKKTGRCAVISNM